MKRHFLLLVAMMFGFAGLYASNVGIAPQTKKEQTEKFEKKAKAQKPDGSKFDANNKPEPPCKCTDSKCKDNKCKDCKDQKCKDAKKFDGKGQPAPQCKDANCKDGKRPDGKFKGDTCKNCKDGKFKDGKRPEGKFKGDTCKHKMNNNGKHLGQKKNNNK